MAPIPQEAVKDQVGKRTKKSLASSSRFSMIGPSDTTGSTAALARDIKAAEDPTLYKQSTPVPPPTPTPPVEKSTSVGFKGSSGQSLQDMAKDMYTDIAQGRDAYSQMTLGRFAEEGAAAEAAAKGASAQRAQLQDLSGTTQNVIAQQTQRDLEQAKQQGIADIAIAGADRAATAAGMASDIEQQQAAAAKGDFEQALQYVDENNPEEVAKLRELASKAGLDFSFDDTLYEIGRSKHNADRADLLTNFQTNSSSYFNDTTGEFDPNLMIEDYENREVLERMFEREFDEIGLDGETTYDPNNPNHRQWAIEQVTPSMTSLDEAAMQESRDYVASIKTQPWYTDLDANSQAAIDEGLNEWMSVIGSGGSIAVGDDKVTITNPDGSTIEEFLPVKTDSGNSYTQEDDGTFEITAADGTVYTSREEDGEQVIDTLGDVSTGTLNQLAKAELEGGEYKPARSSITYTVDGNTATRRHWGTGVTVEYERDEDGVWKEKETVPVSDFDSGITVREDTTTDGEDTVDPFRAEGDVWEDDGNYYTKVNNRDELIVPQSITIPQASAVLGQMLLGEDVPDKILESALGKIDVNNPSLDITEDSIREITDYVASNPNFELNELQGYKSTNFLNTRGGIMGSDVGDYIITDGITMKVADDSHFRPKYTLLAKDGSEYEVAIDKERALGGTTATITDSNGDVIGKFVTSSDKPNAEYIKLLQEL